MVELNKLKLKLGKEYKEMVAGLNAEGFSPHDSTRGHVRHGWPMAGFEGCDNQSLGKCVPILNRPVLGLS